MERKQQRRPGPDDSKSARTRQRILDSTAAVLSRKGYSETKLIDVATEAQLRSPAIYYYFDSREELIEEVMWAGIAHLREHVEDVLDSIPPETPPLDRILAAVEAHLRFSLSVSAYTSAAIRNTGQVPDRIRARHDEERAKYGTLWRKLFVYAHGEGGLRDGIDLVTVQMLILGSLNWAAEWWNPERRSIDTAVASARQLITSGIAHPSSAQAARCR